MSPRQTTDFDVRLGEAVRMQRKLRKMTQKDLADAVGVTFQQVQKYEGGVNRIAAGTLVKVAAALDCQVMSLMSIADGPMEISVLDHAMLAYWRKLTPAQQDAVLHLVRALGDAQAPRHDPE